MKRERSRTSDICVQAVLSPDVTFGESVMSHADVFERPGRRGRPSTSPFNLHSYEPSVLCSFFKLQISSADTSFYLAADLFAEVRGIRTFSGPSKDLLRPEDENQGI